MEPTGQSICFTLLTVLVYAAAMLVNDQPPEPEQSQQPTKFKTTIPPHYNFKGNNGEENDDSHTQLSTNNSTNADFSTNSADETESKTVLKSERALGCNSGDASTSEKPESFLPGLNLPGTININPGMPYIIRIVIPNDNYRTNLIEQPDGTKILDFISSPPSKSQRPLHSGRNIHNADNSILEQLERTYVPSSGTRPVNMMSSDQNTRPPFGNIDVLRMDPQSNPNSIFSPTNANPQSGQNGNVQNFHPNPTANYLQPSNAMSSSYNEAQPQVHRYAPTYQQSDSKSYPNSALPIQRSASHRYDDNVPLNMGQVDTTNRGYPTEVPRMEMVLSPENENIEANGGRNVHKIGQGYSKGITAPDDGSAVENPAVDSVRNSAEPNNIRPGNTLNFGQPHTSEQFMGPNSSGNVETPSDGGAKQINEGFNQAPGHKNVDNTNPTTFGSIFSLGNLNGDFGPSDGGAKQFIEGSNQAPGNKYVDNTNPSAFGPRFNSGNMNGDFGPSDGAAKQFIEGFNQAAGNKNVDNTNPSTFAQRFSSGNPQGHYSFSSSGSYPQGQYLIPSSGSNSQGTYSYSPNSVSSQGQWSSSPGGYSLQGQPQMSMIRNGNNPSYTVPQTQNTQSPVYAMSRSMGMSSMSQPMSVSSISQPMSVSPMNFSPMARTMSMSYSGQPTMSIPQRVNPMEISPIMKAFSPTVRNITHVAQAAPTVRTVSRALGDSDENNGEPKSN